MLPLAGESPLGPLLPEHIEELFNLVLAESKRLQHEMRQMEAAAPAR